MVIGGAIGIRRADSGRGRGDVVIMRDSIGISYMGRRSSGRGGRHRRVVDKRQWGLKRQSGSLMLPSRFWNVLDGWYWVMQQGGGLVRRAKR